MNLSSDPGNNIPNSLESGEQFYKNLISVSLDGLLLVDPQGEIAFVSGSVKNVLGYDPADLLHKNAFSFVHPDDQHKAIDAFQKELKGQPEVNFISIRLLIKDGGWLWCLVRGHNLLDNHYVRKIAIYFHDDTPRKKLETELIHKQISYQKQLTQATIDAQERERKEIGKELHDNFGQQLTTIKLFLEIARNTADDATNELLNLGLKGISDVINEVRSMSRALLPHTLKDLGLVETLYEMKESMSLSRLLLIDLDLEEFTEEDLNETRQLALYRIIQEQTNYITKHGGANTIEIQLKTKEGKVFLRMKDDGKGSAVNSTQQEFVFANIRNRAELLGGTVNVTAHPSHGSVLTIEFPTSERETVQS